MLIATALVKPLPLHSWSLIAMCLSVAECFGEAAKFNRDLKSRFPQRMTSLWTLGGSGASRK
ncbi:MAG: hypothetical protein ACI9UA_004410 [Pseudoalteromonas tetraodonis]|jgi:hypothetical protein